MDLQSEAIELQKVFHKDYDTYWQETEAIKAHLEARFKALGLYDVSGSVIKPPLGLMPKKFHNERMKIERFNEVRGAIARYYDAGLKINIEWIEEYNELVESVGKHYR